MGFNKSLYENNFEPKPEKHSCLGCVHLEFIEDDAYESRDSGYTCNGRDYKNENEEWAHLEMLNRPDYRAKSKRCFTPPRRHE